MIKKNWTELIKPKALKVDQDTFSNVYGKFEAKPLERGFGITLGNSLRRVLLSSLYGMAVSQVKIDNVLHEFSTIKNVVEDVTDIILNLKNVRFNCDGKEEAQIYIDAKGEKKVTARDIVCEAGIEVLNPDLHIATIYSTGHLKIEMKVKLGRGYVPSEKNKEEGDEIGVIPVDSMFSPVKKVNYQVTNTRVGQRTDYDKLVVEIWTDGSVRPDDAIAYAAKILKDQLTVFINFEEEIEEEVSHKVDEKTKMVDNLNKPVSELELSVRSANCLQNADIKFIGELVQRSEGEMLKTKNFGRKSLNEIKEILHIMGLGLGMKIESWEPPQEVPQDDIIIEEDAN
jgi:DNA-directed RNA polymerase subunit alpha